MELLYPKKRRKSRVVKIGDVLIGGGFPIAVKCIHRRAACCHPPLVAWRRHREGQVGAVHKTARPRRR